MIKLNRREKPNFLTAKKEEELTQEFISNKSSVWNIEQIKKPLLESSYFKCAYCECPLTTESNYMEVEHFEDKSHTPQKVVQWDNLLPSCKKCNGSKSTHNVITEPIINPFNINPKEHLAFRLYRLKAKTNIGENTIDVTDLNNSTRLVMVRFNIGEKINQVLEAAIDKLEKLKNKNTSANKNKLIGSIEGLLNECQPTATYSATSATLLLTDLRFIEIKKYLMDEHMWSNELDNLFICASQLKLDYV